LAGYGDAFAGRGQALNTSIQSLGPFFSYLTQVTSTLNDPNTRLKDFFPQLGETVAQLAPVAKINADLFANMATTFQALSADPRALQQTIEKSPGTMDTAVRSFRVQRPFLADATDLSRRLRPAIQQLPRSLPLINSALKAGIPVLPRTVALNQRLNGTFSALDHLFSNPNTLLAFHDLRTTLTVTKPALEFVAPYQTVCNYWNYFVFPLGEHQSQVSSLGGTAQNQGARFPNLLQANSLGNFQASRPVDTPPGVDPIGANVAGQKLDRFYAQPQQPAIDAQGNADCQIGQNGFVRGPLGPNRYKPGTAPNGDPSGGNASVSISNFPILSGGTYVSRKLGLNNLKDVDKLKK
jgi:hypothetical protein